MKSVSSTGIQRPSMIQVLIDLNDCLATEIAQGRNRKTDNHGYGHLTHSVEHDIAIGDTSFEMGPMAR